MTIFEQLRERVADAIEHGDPGVSISFELAQEISDALPLGKPVDPRFRPTARDLIALREDAKASGHDGLQVKVIVAPAVLYIGWPNTKHDPSDEESTPYRCISLSIPKPE